MAERLVLKGVARHDMWKEQGFTLTRRQMEQDMRMIKAMGANFIRQVHYPHHRYLTDLADEYGLLISEEPGYWNMDFQTMPRTMIESGVPDHGASDSARLEFSLGFRLAAFE